MIRQGLIGKVLKIICVDGDKLTGCCQGYVGENDNESGQAGVYVETENGLVELFEGEIQSVDIV